MSDDLRELIGRYATGSLSEEERARLFEAALDDQDLFDELAREQGVRQLLAEPGARERLVRALEPPKRRAAWFALAAVSGLVAASVVIAVMMKPVPKPAPQIVAVVNPAPQPAEAVREAPVAAPAPARTGPVSKNKAALDEVARDTQVDKKEAGTAGKNELRKDEPVQAEAAEQKVATLVAAGSPAPQPAAAQDAAKQQNAPGGPRQQQIAGSRAAFAQVPPVAFHYSYDAGHLKILASTAGFLTIRTSAGVLLYATQATPAGSTVEVALPEDAASVIVVFSYLQTAPATKPEPHAEPSGNLLAPGTAAMELKIPR
jgi:pyruvate/2-oxoglutarate dehydrogenase complex dihydrolipoamide acyltransferase (E2) component